MIKSNKNIITINNLTIKACSYTDLVYYYRAKYGYTYLKAVKEVDKICNFLNTDFGCHYRKSKPTGQDLYDAKYGGGLNG
jgi:hypothetical protein|tara:strand:+ start:58 stop:297 length:240 start_codon:yes stop_codon:yes gene_type:complete